jgi:hypothetical protein
LVSAASTSVSSVMKVLCTHEARCALKPSSLRRASASAMNFSASATVGAPDGGAFPAG